MIKAETLKELFEADTGPLHLESSVISISKTWPNRVDNCSYKVEAESHCTHIYPNDKLDLAIQRFLYLYDECESYVHTDHQPYELPY